MTTLKKILLPALLILLTSSGCSTSRNLESGSHQESFSSYEEAINYVQTNEDLTHLTVDTGKSSWVQSADFYYYPGDTSGYAIFELSNRLYIHEGVPLEIWQGFTHADSFGTFYNQNLKGNYIFDLN